MRDASICGLGQTAAERDRVGAAQARPLREREHGHEHDRTIGAPRAAPSSSTLDGETVAGPEDQTILDVAQREGIDTPTLC